MTADRLPVLFTDRAGSSGGAPPIFGWRDMPARAGNHPGRHGLPAHECWPGCGPAINRGDVLKGEVRACPCGAHRPTAAAAFSPPHRSANGCSRPARPRRRQRSLAAGVPGHQCVQLSHARIETQRRGFFTPPRRLHRPARPAWISAGARRGNVSHGSRFADFCLLGVLP